MFGRRRRNPPLETGAPSSGQGMFAGYILPQDPRGILTGQQLDLMTGPPAIRLGGQARGRNYFGTDAVPPMHPQPQPKVNREIDFELAPIKDNYGG